ncbi:hypothetical protein HYH03_013216 [Edaphochlamys debaryana]|uniref:SET domain-containing protein n=1 Tax=Edaphochlamys debaryana TaxID=47281 RepID=A0A835XQ72_9CHLO|nr:hypothetical protein HYH03_013216 [Edaphochlamys debaryana]|eukprot:KAG2488223.1 hypothetical protein HYH03_013216 [Edaphochlamys debaryana]
MHITLKRFTFTLLAVFAARANADAPADGAHTTPAEQALIQWLLDSGGQVNVQIHRDSSGVRGLSAAAATAAGSVLVRVPLSSAITLGEANDTAPELAIRLLRERHRSRPRYGPYFAVLPPAPGSEGWAPSCGEELPAAAVEALAGPGLRELLAAKRSWLRAVCSGAAPGLPLPLARAVPRAHVSEEEFAWATCMVSSRSISGPGGAMLAIPLIDLANHCGSRARRQPDTLRFRRLTAGEAGAEGAEAGAKGVGAGDMVLELVAGADLQPGEEVCISYGQLAPDEALLYYGFLEGAGAQAATETETGTCAWQQPPPLCAVDEAGYDPGARPGKVRYERLEAAAAAVDLAAEAARLESRLAAVAAEAEAVRAGPAAGCPESPQAVRGGVDARAEAPDPALCLVSALNGLREAGLRAELARVRALAAGVKAPSGCRGQGEGPGGLEAAV